MTYVISLVNDSDTALTDLTITDDLGGYAFDGATVYPLSYVDGTMHYYLNGVLQEAPAVTAGPPLVISGIEVPANGNAILVYEARVTEYAPLGAGAEITNTASITGAGADLTASATVPMAGEPELTISKAMSPDEVAPGDELTYTFVLQNTGSEAAEAADSIVVTDVFDPVLTGLAVTLDGVTLTAGTDYTYDETTGVFATAAGRITVPGATYTQNADGVWATNPGTAVLVVTGTVLTPGVQAAAAVCAK